MKIEKDVTIYVEYFVDVLEIIDKMNIIHPDTVICMDEEKFLEGKCHIIMGDTMFLFLPVHKLFNKNSDSKKYKLTRYVHECDDHVEIGEFDSIDEARKAGQADMEKVFCGRYFTTMKDWKETSYGFKNEALHGDDDYIYVIAKKEDNNDI